MGLGKAVLGGWSWALWAGQSGVRDGHLLHTVHVVV